MAYTEIRYGVTWKTTSERKPTTVWFKSTTSRAQHVADLNRNRLVIKRSISLTTRRLDGKVVRG